jgi:hypothetical protein
MHPNYDKPYDIYTDACKTGISAVLTQIDDAGETLVVSTASRALTKVEKNYTTCEQGLLAVVYALQKFRIYVTGHPIRVYFDNKALSFLKKCNLTPGRITRWILQLQEYDLEIMHIKGTENYFADILSRSTITDSHLPKKSNECLVAKTNFYLDQALKGELSKLA